jgi:hypothetical protein
LEIKEEVNPDDIDYIEEEYLDPIYLNEGINPNMEIDEEETEEEVLEYFEEVDNPLDEESPKRSKISIQDDLDDNEDEGKTFFCGFCPKSFGKCSDPWYRFQNSQKFYMVIVLGKLENTM